VDTGSEQAKTDARPSHAPRTRTLLTSFFDPEWLSARWFWIVAIALAIGAAIAVLHFGPIQFGGEDGGILADIAYMGKLGYHPYTEINTTGFPPVYVLAAGWAFRLFGVRWTSLVDLAAIFSALALLTQAWLTVRAGLGRLSALLLAAATQAATMLPLASWGYNQTTAVLGALYLTATLGFLLKPKDRVARLALVATAVAVSWGKPNVAALLLVLTALVFLLDRDTRWPGIGLLACAAVTSCVLLFVSGADPRTVLSSYLVASARVTPHNFKLFFWTNDNAEVRLTLSLLAPAALAGLASFVKVVFQRKRWGVKRLAFCAAASIGVLTGIVAMGTNNDYNLVDAPVLLVGCVALVWLARDWNRAWTRAVVVAGLLVSLLGLTASGLSMTATRYRIYAIGPGRYWQAGPLSSVGGLPMMADVQTGSTFRQIVADVGSVLRLNPTLAGSGPSVFFGPRLLMMYPEWGIAPPMYLPTWWAERPDGDPRTTAIEDRLLADRYKLMIFAKHDYYFYPASLKLALYSDYDVYDWDLLTIHVLKGATDVQVPLGAVRTN
jgi:hypothetical protein